MELSKYESAPLINTYKRLPVSFVKGEGALLWDSEGKEYIDCLAGIAVVSAGHSNGFIAEKISEQASQLVHVSNLYWTEQTVALATKLNQISGFGKVFFGNSGAEANECAFKIARKWAGEGRYEVICAKNSFHGRTLATLHATGQEKKWQGFEPLPEGFVHGEFNNLESFRNLVTERTAAIMIEPVQGEGGIVPVEDSFINGLRALCDEHGLALIFDEVQCGICRTGKWWAHQHYGVRPDILTSAKALGNGVPISACIVAEHIASAFGPGDHGSTNGGGVLASTAALASLEFLETQGVMAGVEQKRAQFEQLLGDCAEIQQVRGLGLMMGVVLQSEIAVAVQDRLFADGLIVNAVRPNILRLTPPLIITEEQISAACEKIIAACAQEAAS